MQCVRSVADELVSSSVLPSASVSKVFAPAPSASLSRSNSNMGAARTIVNAHEFDRYQDGSRMGTPMHQCHTALIDRTIALRIAAQRE